MSRACVMRNGSIYNPVLPGFEGLINESEESVSQESVSEGEEATEVAKNDSKTERQPSKKDAISAKGKSK